MTSGRNSEMKGVRPLLRQSGRSAEPGIERSAVHRGHPVATCQKLRGHAARAGPEFQPARSGRRRRLVEPKVVQCPGDLATRAADRPCREKFLAARVKTVGFPWRGRAGEQTRFAHQHIKRAITGIDRACVPPTCIPSEKLERATAQVRGQPPSRRTRGTTVERTYQQGSRLLGQETGGKSRRRFLHESIHPARRTGPGMTDRQHPPEKLRNLRHPQRRGIGHLRQEEFPARTPRDLRAGGGQYVTLQRGERRRNP